VFRRRRADVAPTAPTIPQPHEFHRRVADPIPRSRAKVAVGESSFRSRGWDWTYKRTPPRATGVTSEPHG
jgi:hypothetical protein